MLNYPSLDSQCGGFEESLGHLRRPSGSGEGRVHAWPRRLCVTQGTSRAQLWSLVRICETFPGPSGSRKGAGVPEIEGEAESTLPTAKEVTACNVYLRIVGKVVTIQNTFPVIPTELLKFNPYRIHSFCLRLYAY